MTETELHDLLEKLHAQIETTQTIGEKNLAELRDLEKDIRALLDRSQGEGLQAQPGVVQRLEDALGVFEVSHPTLAVAITDVLVILSNAGI